MSKPAPTRGLPGHRLPPSAGWCFVPAILLVVAGCVADQAASTNSKSANSKKGDTSDNSQTVSKGSQDDNRPQEVPSELNAAHILIMHNQSARKPPHVNRTKEEALTRANEVAAKARQEDADFAALAREYSDGPSGADGGNLGNFEPDAMVGPFSDATMRLKIGEISAPIETDFGYHIILRKEPQIVLKASAKHILVMYEGSMRAPGTITRTKVEARARIEECLKRVRAGEEFEDLAREYSDGPTSIRGGDLGEFKQGMMAPAFDKATFECEVGKTTEIVETPFGFHIIYRYK